MSKFIRTEALVIKRTNYADADRFVTLFSQDFGKISALARGVRKITSRKRSALEPFSRVKVHLVKGKVGYLVSEAEVVDSFLGVKQTLPRLTQAMQIVEIIDSLTAEEEVHWYVYRELIKTFELLDKANLQRKQVIDMVKFVLDDLGFGYPSESEMQLKDHIESITQKPLRSKRFLMQI